MVPTMNVRRCAALVLDITESPSSFQSGPRF